MPTRDRKALTKQDSSGNQKHNRADACTWDFRERLKRRREVVAGTKNMVEGCVERFGNNESASQPPARVCVRARGSLVAEMRLERESLQHVGKAPSPPVSLGANRLLRACLQVEEIVKIAAASRSFNSAVSIVSRFVCEGNLLERPALFLRFRAAVAVGVRRLFSNSALNLV